MTRENKQSDPRLDRKLDDALRQTFPASDPVAVSIESDDQAVFLDNRSQNRFELKVDGLNVIMEYELLPGVLKVTHTEVPKELEGRGLASRIAALVVREARRRGMSLVPVCPFFRAYLKKHPEHSDLIDTQHRES